MTAVLLLTAAVAIGLHGLGRGIERSIGERNAPVALVIAWAVAVVVLVGGGLDATGAWVPAVHIVLFVAGIALTLWWLVVRRARVTGRRIAWTPIVLACALGVFAVLSAAGDRHGAGEAGHAARGLHHAFVTLTGPLDDAGTRHLADDGWGFALVLALLFVLVPPGAGVARAALILVLAAAPLDGHDLAPRWTVVALVLSAAATYQRALAWRARALAGVLLAASALLALTSGSPLHAAISFALGALIIGAAYAVSDERALASVAGCDPDARGLAAVVVALGVVLALTGARARAGWPASNWTYRMLRRIDAAAAIGDLPPVRAVTQARAGDPPPPPSH